MYFVLSALTFGLAAGLKPGPLGVFIIHQTLSRGNFQGFISSLAPILTDGPIIILALVLAIQLNELSWFVSLISILGSIYLANLAYKIFKTPNNIDPSSGGGVKSSLAMAVKINFLSPAPYIFWLTIGSGYILMGSKSEATIFIICALFSLCVTKFAVAVAIKKLGERFNPKFYSYLLRSLSFPLILFSAQLLYSGIVIWL